VERLGYWIDEGYLGCYSRWVSCEIVELPGGLGHCTLFVSGVARSLGLVEEGLVELRPGARLHELTDWLGGVRVVVTDQRIPIRGNNQVVVGYRAEVVSVRDYYSYGLDISERSYGSPIHPYRYSFNGKEDLREQRWYQDYGARFYHKALARFVSADPLIVSQKKYAWLSSYQFASSSPVWAVDLDGLEMFIIHGSFEIYGHRLSKLAIEQLKRITGNTKIDQGFKWQDESWSYIMLLGGFWGGDSSGVLFREDWAKRLAEYVVRKRFEMIVKNEITPDEPISLVGYSHGGNVAIQAAHILYRRYRMRVNLVTISTLAYDYWYKDGTMSFHPENPAINPGIKRHYHIVHERDEVVRIAGGDKIYRTCSPKTKNYVISCSESDLGWLGSHRELPKSHDLVKFLEGLPPMNEMGVSDSSESGSPTTREKREWR